MFKHDAVVFLDDKYWYFKIQRNKKHAGHTRKASRISKTAVDNFGKGWATFICHS